MRKYERYKTSTLLKFLKKAKDRYNSLTVRSSLGWGYGMRHSKLPSLTAWSNARERVCDLEEELKKRGAL